MPEKPAPRTRRLTQALLIGLAIVALLCLGGASAVFLFYNKATKADLSTPVGVTLDYLQSYLVDRNDAKALQYRCGNDSGLKDLAAFRDDVDQRQRTYDVVIRVSVNGAVEVARSNGAATTTADLDLQTTIQGQPQRVVEHWTFKLRDEDGWRVCEGHEVT